MQPSGTSLKAGATLGMTAAMMPPDPQAGVLDRKSDEEALDLLGPSDAKDRRNELHHGNSKAEAAQLPGNTRRPTHAQLLIAIAEAASLFHTPAGDAYVTILVDGHAETWPLRSRGFTGWLRRTFYMVHGKPPNAQALTDALGILEAQAQFDGGEHPVSLRVGEFGGRVYVDLVNDHWEVVEIGPGCWRVVPESPVRFRRARGMLPIQPPVGGGSSAELRQFVNVQSDDWPLVLAWLVACFRPRGPYPVLVLQGEQGSAKSTSARFLRALVDPSAAPLRATPRSEQELMIALNNGWVIAFDNLSRLPDWLSDGLCRVATGAGFAVRQLYTDADEVIFAGQRPVILNGITEIATRDDLRDRALLVTCPPLSGIARMEEALMEEMFAAAQPRLVGALFDAVSAALRNFSRTALTAKPRMADFARWSVAAEPAFPWSPGTFLLTYTRNQQLAVEQSLEFDSIGAAVRQLAEEKAWDGTVGELLEQLRVLVADHLRDGREWPQNARALSNRLHRAMPALRQVGVLVEFGSRTKKGRTLAIRKVLHGPVTPVTADMTTVQQGGLGDGGGDGNRPPEPIDDPVVTLKEPSLLISDGGDGGDGGDGAPQNSSGEEAPWPAGLGPRALLDVCSKCGTERRYLADGARCCQVCYPDGGGIGWADDQSYPAAGNDGA
jgi:hypothetical protein